MDNSGLAHFGGYLDNISQLSGWLEVAKGYRDNIFLLDLTNLEDRLTLVLNKDLSAKSATGYTGELPYVISAAFSHKIRQLDDKKLSSNEKINLIYQHIQEIFDKAPVNFTAYGSRDNDDILSICDTSEFFDFSYRSFNNFLFDLSFLYKGHQKIEHERREVFFGILYRYKQLEMYSCVINQDDEPFIGLKLYQLGRDITLLLSKNSNGKRVDVAGAFLKSAGLRSADELSDLENNLKMVQAQLSNFFRNPPFSLQAYNDLLDFYSPRTYIPLRRTELQAFWLDTFRYYDEKEKTTAKPIKPSIFSYLKELVKKFI